MSPESSLKQGVVWEVKGEKLLDEKHPICGSLVLDMDGTLTEPKIDYSIDEEVIPVLSDFLVGGGNIVLNTGATKGRIERTLLVKLYTDVHKKKGREEAESSFKRVFLNPENGSALLTFDKTVIEENELFFVWNKNNEYDVPDKKLLKEMLEEEILPKHPGSHLLGNWKSDFGQRDYIVTLKKVENTLDLKKFFDSDEFRQSHTDIDWDNISIKAARTSIDFIHKGSGKTVSVQSLIKELAPVGPVVGFGDLGDEFAKVVPTFNVNAEKPNEFRLRDMPAMDVVQDWVPLSDGTYIITSEGKKTLVCNKQTNDVIPVLRDKENRIINSPEGHPIEITPIKVRGNNGEECKLAGAGKSTAWMIRRLMEVGYFSLC